MMNLQDYDITAKPIHITQFSYVSDSLKHKLTENWDEINPVIDMNMIIQETSVATKLLELKICLETGYKYRVLKDCNALFNRLSEWRGLLFVDYSIWNSTELEKHVIEALHFSHRGSAQMLADGMVFCWHIFGNDIQEKPFTFTTYMFVQRNFSC